MNEDTNQCDNGKSFRINGNVLFAGAIILIIVTVFVTFLVADRIYYNGALFRKSESVTFSGDNLEEYKVDKFQDLLRFIDEYYCLDYDVNDVIEGAISGAVEALGDPYSSYIEPGLLDEYVDFITGTYIGAGFVYKNTDKGLEVLSVESGSPTEKAGILAGDRIKGVNGIATNDAVELKHLFLRLAGKEVIVDIERQGGTMQVTLPVDAEGRIGIIMATPFSLRTRHYSFWESIPAGARLTVKQLKDYWQQLKMIFSPKTEMYKSLGGFISIGSIFPSEWNWLSFWSTTAFLSIILAVMNIIPIPGLDGGHSLFTLWEMITRRKPSDKFLEIAQYIGLILLLILLVYANGNDIYRFFIK